MDAITPLYNMLAFHIGGRIDLKNSREIKHSNMFYLESKVALVLFIVSENILNIYAPCNVLSLEVFENCSLYSKVSPLRLKSKT